MPILNLGGVTWKLFLSPYRRFIMQCGLSSHPDADMRVWTPDRAEHYRRPVYVASPIHQNVTREYLLLYFTKIVFIQPPTNINNRYSHLLSANPVINN
jgi:hypothetical protein